MEVVALNAELRREFSPVLKLLRAPPAAATAQHTPRSNGPVAAAAEASAAPLAPAETSEPSAAPSEDNAITSSAADAGPVPTAALEPLLPVGPNGPQQLARIDRFRQHCLSIVQRLNACEYTSKRAFSQEIAQLSLLARSSEQQQALQLLSERVAALEMAEKSNTKRVKAGSLQFDSTAGIPGLQEVSTDVAESTGGAKKWLCNVNINEQAISIGSFLTRENALKAYDLFRFDLNTNRGGVASVYKLADQLAADQRQADERVLEAAMSGIHSQLAWQRLQDMLPLSATLAPEKETAVPVAAATPSKTPSQRATSNKATPVSPASPCGSSAESASAATTAGGEPRVQKRKKPAERLAHLRLRRLIQKRLCPHLKGKEVCVVVRRGEISQEKVDWTPTGRLENGKVFVYKRSEQVTFADFVSEAMGHIVSACPHIFLVKTRESIDDHLRVCDAFSEAERVQLGVDFTSSYQNYVKAPEAKTRRR